MKDHPGHDELQDFILDPEDAEQVRRHLESCGECLEQAGRLRSERARLAEALSTPAPAGLASRILDLTSFSAPRRRAWATRIPLAVAAGLFLAVVGTLLFRGTHATPGELALGNGTRIALAPSAEARVRDSQTVDLRRGSGKFRMPPATRLTVVTPLGNISAHAAEFSVELRTGPMKGEAAMESLLALVVTVMAGNLSVDLPAGSTSLTAGETRVFGAELAVPQDKDDGEKNEKGKNEKGKKNDKDDGDKEDGKKKEKKDDKGEKEDDGKEKGKKKKDKKEDD